MFFGYESLCGPSDLRGPKLKTSNIGNVLNNLGWKYFGEHPTCYLHL